MRSRSPTSLFLPVLVCLTLLFVGWRVLSLGLAEHHSRNRPERALAWRVGHPVALVGAAERLASSNPSESRKLALAALRANPLEGRAYRVLGAMAEHRGDLSGAVKLYELASVRSPRDLPTHLWLEQHYLSTGKLSQALEHLDLLLRIEPQTQVNQYPLLRTLVALPQAHAGLAELFAKDPPWRRSFLVELSAKAEDSVAIAPFMGRLRLSSGGLDEAELSAWIERLTKDQRWGEAYLTWASTLPRPQQAELGNLFNGGFEREPSNAGFDWRFMRTPGAYVERLPVAGANGEVALRVSFEGRRVDFQHVKQLLALAPGRYRLLGRERSEGLRSERGLVWSVRCADNNQTIASSDPLKGSSPWRPFTVDFSVPAGSCGGQWLQLAVPARIAAERRIGGSASFDDLRIVREQ